MHKGCVYLLLLMDIPYLINQNPLSKSWICVLYVRSAGQDSLRFIQCVCVCAPVHVTHKPTHTLTTRPPKFGAALYGCFSPSARLSVCCFWCGRMVNPWPRHVRLLVQTLNLSLSSGGFNRSWWRESVGINGCLSSASLFYGAYLSFTESQKES